MFTGPTRLAALVWPPAVHPYPTSFVFNDL